MGSRRSRSSELVGPSRFLSGHKYIFVFGPFVDGGPDLLALPAVFSAGHSASGVDDPCFRAQFCIGLRLVPARTPNVGAGQFSSGIFVLLWNAANRAAGTTANASLIFRSGGGLRAAEIVWSSRRNPSAEGRGGGLV